LSSRKTTSITLKNIRSVFFEEGRDHERPGINFLDETLFCLFSNGKTIDDVLWVGVESGEKITEWEHFKQMADFLYENCLSETRIPEIDPRLVIVGKGWWLKRVIFNRIEQWQYQKNPEMANIPGLLLTVRVRG